MSGMHTEKKKMRSEKNCLIQKADEKHNRKLRPLGHYGEPLKLGH